MQPMKRACLILGFVTGIVLSSQPSDAQYAADYQTNIISGVTSNWSGDYLVGSNTFADVLLIQSGGVLTNWKGFLGYEISSSNNSVLVSDNGSTWSNRNDLYIGYSGAGNSLTISNGGRVVTAGGRDHIGYNNSSSNNIVLVSGAGSVWTNCWSLKFGWNGPGNRLVIIDGGEVVTGPTGQEDDCVGTQASSSNNSVLVTGSGSVWNDYNWMLCFGLFGMGNDIVISNGGKIANNSGCVGNFGSNKNSVRVTGTESVWSNRTDLYFGYSGDGNSLTIDAGAQLVVCSNAYMRYNSISSNNSVLVSGPGSVWSNKQELYVGWWSKGNRLVISNGGEVGSSNSYVGHYSSSRNNTVRAVNGGVWQNGSVRVGNEGSSNSLFVIGGAVLATNLIVGFYSGTCDNLVQLDSGSIVVTNATGDAVFEARNGKLILNGGVLQVDRFVMTNECAQFVRNGGTLNYGTAVLDPTRDDDGDGMPNGWEQSHGLDPLSADADLDPDGDGQSVDQ